jgi:hypothetical protein
MAGFIAGIEALIPDIIPVMGFCPPESSGFASRSAFSAEAGPDIALAARCGILRSESASDGGSNSSRCRIRFPMPQILAVAALALDRPAQHG